MAQLYHDALSREVDPAGMAHWLSVIQAGWSRSDVAKQILSSAEYYAKVVGDLYRQYLERDADPSGLQTGMAFLAGGGSRVMLAAQLLASDEYYQLFGQGNNQGFLRALYLAALGRSNDSSGEASNLGRLNGGVPGQEIAFRLLSSWEGCYMRARGDDTTLFRDINNPGGVAEVARMLRHQEDALVLAALFGLPEYIIHLSYR